MEVERISSYSYTELGIGFAGVSLGLTQLGLFVSSASIIGATLERLVYKFMVPEKK
jgi:hypothetical protein